jgi:hypothetical protein
MFVMTSRSEKSRNFTRKTFVRMFYAKIAMRGTCTESPRKWLNTAGAYLVQAPEPSQEMPGEGRAVPPVYPRASEGTPSFTQLAILAKKVFFHHKLLDITILKKEITQ